MFKLHLNPFYSPNDSSGSTPIEDGKMSISDMTDFLGKDNDETIELEEDPTSDEEDSESGKEEEVSEKATKEETLEDELENELKEPDDDEIVMPVRRKEVLSKYPNIFKEFPHLDKAVYREQKYAELLPTLKDARAAVDKAETLDNFSQELGQGNTINILQAVKEEDPEAFNRIVDGYLPTLQKVDKDAYFHVLGNVIKHTVLAMHNSEDADTKTAASILHRFIFNTDKFDPPHNLSNVSNEKDERESKLEEREVEFRKEQLDTHVSSVNTRIDNVVKSTIDKNIDPRGSMNDYVKARAIRDCAEDVDNEIRKDVRFRGIIDKLWEKAADTSYSQESLDKIKSAYLSKAKGLLPQIIRNKRNQALKGLGAKSPNERVPNLPVGKPASTKSNSSQQNANRGSKSDKDRAREIPKGMRSVDFLMRD